MRVDTSTAMPIRPGIAASLIASHWLSSLSRPMPPVSSTLIRPSRAMKLNLRYLTSSNVPQPRGNASARTSAPSAPRLASPLSFIRISDGIRMLISKSTNGRGLCVAVELWVVSVMSFMAQE
ncbi:hypothetical protein D3C71_1715900 [compost metagenome]